MITSLHHLVLVCQDIETAKADYTALFGKEPDWISIDANAGTKTVLFNVENTALELIGAFGDGGGAEKLSAMCEAEGEGLKSLAFHSNNLEDDHKLFTRRGMSPSDITTGDSRHAETGAERSWRRFRLADEASHGLKLFVLGDVEGDIDGGAVATNGVGALDHVVVSTPNPDRAAALYGARLGLHLALDRENKDWDTRFLFFKTGGVVFEVINRLSAEQAPTDNDHLWGVTWRVCDLEAAHLRLSKEGFEVSEIRIGRKPGTRVFTVRNRTCNTPTLFLEQTPQ